MSARTSFFHRGAVRVCCCWGGGFLYQSPFVFEDNKPEKNSHGGERRGTEDSESGEERGEGGEEREIKS